MLLCTNSLAEYGVPPPHGEGQAAALIPLMAEAGGKINRVGQEVELRMVHGPGRAEDAQVPTPSPGQFLGCSSSELDPDLCL